MATQKIALLIHKGKEIAQKLNILGGQNGAGAQGNPVIVQAQAGAKYQLALENENGLAPENIGVKRMGDDLHIAFEGGDIDAPDLIIEDYYQDDDGAAGYADAAPHELIGMHENGAMYSFVPESALPAEAISVLGNGAEAAQVLGGALGAGPAALGINPAAFAPLLGLAGLGGGGGGGGGGAAPAPSRVIPTPSINKVTDDQNPQPLNNPTAVSLDIASGNRTNDGTPLVKGKLSQALQNGETLELHATVKDDAGNVVSTGRVGTFNGTGTDWQVQDNTGYKNGDKVEYSVKVVDAAGNETVGSNTWSVEMDTKVQVVDQLWVDVRYDEVTFDYTNAPTNDTISGFKLVNYLGQKVYYKQGSLDSANDKMINNAASTPATYGQTITGYTYDELGNVSEGTTSYDGGGYSSGGETYTLTLDVTDSVTNAAVTTTTTDNKLTFSGEVTVSGASPTSPIDLADYLVAVYDNGKYIGKADVQVDANDSSKGSWDLPDTYTGADYTAGSSHSFTVQLIKEDSGVISATDLPNPPPAVAVDVDADASKVATNTDMEDGVHTSLSLSDVLGSTTVGAGQVLQVKGDDGDILDIGVASADVGWIKTGTADGFGTTAAEQAVQYDVWQSYDGSNFTQVMVEQGIQVI